jgi:hypothetical protein
MKPIRAIGDPPRRSNAQLIADFAELGYFEGLVLDMTYGKGRFWKQHRPDNLVTNDLNPASEARFHHDFTALPGDWGQWFDMAVLDPPYKLNGTASRGGPATSDDDYGVGGEYRTPSGRHELMRRGLTEAARVSRRYVLVKCMDQVVSGSFHWQVDIMTEHAKSLGLRKVDSGLVYGYREQPMKGRKQKHLHRDFSTAIMFEQPGRKRVDRRGTNRLEL